MYCPSCGNLNNDEAKFCSNCGSAFYISTSPSKIHVQPRINENPPPIMLIIITWFLVIISYIPMGQVSILVSIAIVICAVFLLVSKNRTAKINGWIVIGLWAVTFLLGFFNSLAK